MRRTEPLLDITPIGIEFVAAAFAGCALRRRDIAQVVPHRIARYRSCREISRILIPWRANTLISTCSSMLNMTLKRAKIYTRWVSFKLLAVGQFKGSSSLCVKGKQPVQLE